MKARAPTPRHHAFRGDAIALLKKHAGQLDAQDMLALAAHLVGQIVAMQDQRKVTREMALEIVARAPTPRHHAFRGDAIALLKKHAGQLDAQDMLALAAHLVGQIVAMQDQRKVTREMALEIVARNIEAGNAEAIANLGNSAGSA